MSFISNIIATIYGPKQDGGAVPTGKFYSSDANVLRDALIKLVGHDFFFNPKDYGAVLDGVTDDYIALTNMLVDIGTSNSVVFCVGSTRTSVGIAFPANVVFVHFFGSFNNGGLVTFDGLRVKIAPDELTLVGPNGRASYNTTGINVNNVFSVDAATPGAASIFCSNGGGGVPIQFVTNNNGVMFDKFAVNTGIGYQYINAITWASATFTSQTIPAHSGVELAATGEGHEGGVVASAVYCGEAMPMGIHVSVVKSTGASFKVRVYNMTTGPITPPTQDIHFVTFSRSN